MMNTQDNCSIVGCETKYRSLAVYTDKLFVDDAQPIPGGSFDFTEPPTLIGTCCDGSSGEGPRRFGALAPCPNRRIVLADVQSTQSALLRLFDVTSEARLSVDYEVVLEFIRLIGAVESAYLLLPAAPKTLDDLKFVKKLRAFAEWKIVPIAQADPVLAMTPAELRAWEWVALELECLSFPRHASRGAVTVVGQPASLAIPSMRRFLYRGGVLDLIGAVDLFSEEVMELAERYDRCRIFDLVADAKAVSMLITPESATVDSNNAPPTHLSEPAGAVS